jgi:hypothetical protein
MLLLPAYTSTQINSDASPLPQAMNDGKEVLMPTPA